MAALRKPPVSAWAINQLARREEKEISTLLQAGAELVEGQRQALAGEGIERLDGASRAQRDAIRRLTAAAGAILKEAGHSTGGQTPERIASTLRAASVDEAGRELLRRGRLSDDFEATGLSLLAGMVSTASTSPRPREAREKDKREVAREQLAAARERVSEARATERELLRRADEEDREAKRAQEAAEAAIDRARSARAEAEQAAEAREGAEGELDRLRGKR